MPRRVTDTRPAPDGEHWGAYSATSALPGTAAGTPNEALTIGDTAAVGGELYVCTATAPLASTWKKALRDGGTIEAATIEAATLGSATVTSLSVTEAVTATAGIIGSTYTRISNIPIGAVAFASLGTNTTPTAGTIYVTEFSVPINMDITGLAAMNGGTVGTDKAIYAIYSAAGALLATTALAGVTTAGANAFQEIALTTTYPAIGGRRYFLAVQYNGNTTRFRSIAASTYLNLTISQAGSFGTLAALDPLPTATVADVGPIMYAY